MEYTETHKFVPMLEGRSSVGRLGISIHSTAGFGDIGFCGYWTLEISCVQPVRIYSGVDICQIYYHTVGRSLVKMVTILEIFLFQTIRILQNMIPKVSIRRIQVFRKA